MSEGKKSQEQPLLPPLFSDKAIAAFGDVDHTLYHTVLRLGSLLAFMQVRDLAREAQVSPASVVRFCKKCGCSGFPEFKVRYCEGLRLGSPSVEMDELDVLKRFIERARGDEYAEAVDSAFELLRWARIVLFLGIGSSAHMAAAGARLFCDAGSFSLHVSDPFTPLLNVPSKDVVVVALSFSGSTPQILSMTGDLVGVGCKVVSITSSRKNPLAKMADVSIAYEVPDVPVSDRLNLGTQVPVLYTLEHLARRLYHDTGGRVRDTHR